MDSSLPTQSPNESDVKLSFRKPSHDAANRKYRRHTPVGGSDSSSSGGSPKRQRSHSPHPSFEDDRQRKDDGRELEKNSDRNRSGRGSESHRHSDRLSYGDSHDYHTNSDYNRYHKHADEEDRGYHRSSRSGRDSRTGMHSDHARYDTNSDRSREARWNTDKYSRDRSEDVGHRSKDEHHRHNDRDSDRSRQYSSREEIRSGDRDRHRDRAARDAKRDHGRSSGDYKNGHGSSREELRGHANDSPLGRDKGSLPSRQIDAQENLSQKRKNNDKVDDRRKDKSVSAAEDVMRNGCNSLSTYPDRDEKNDQFLDKTINISEEQITVKKSKFSLSDDGPLSPKSVANTTHERPSGSSKQIKEENEGVASQSTNLTTSQAEGAQDLNAAKIAAMKAADLVNRNLVGGGYLSTDQKKKLLWGNKKNTSTEEVGNRWDLQLFPDRERQEKFNKLMGVKGDAIPERKPDKDGSLHAEKQEQLQMDLEKQYTAGLRRRDGRTVGLGL